MTTPKNGTPSRKRAKAVRWAIKSKANAEGEDYTVLDEEGTKEKAIWLARWDGGKVVRVEIREVGR